MNNVLIMNSFGFFPNFPSVSTAKVTSLLKTQGVCAFNYDLNLAMWNELLSAEFLMSCEYRKQMTESTEIPFTLNTNKKTHVELKNNAVNNIGHAKEIFKSRDFYDHKKLNWAVNILFQAQQVIFHHYGCFITNKVIFWPQIGYNVNNLDKIYSLSTDVDRNPFIHLYKKVLEPILIKHRPQIIGIDIAFPWEILPVLTINILIKKYFPTIHLNFTGHGFDELSFSRVAHRLSGNHRLFFEFDSLFLARNDTDLQKFYSQKEISTVNAGDYNSLAIRRKDKVEISKTTFESLKEEEIFPDYQDLALSQYYTPHLVLIDKMSNKCYWSKCAFCNINLHKRDASKIEPHAFVKRLMRYESVYKAKHFFLLDEAIDPDYVSSLCDILLETKRGYIWSVRTRIDEGFTFSLLQKMYDAGCRELWIGMENASPKLLKSMNKAANTELYIAQIEQIMKDSDAVGIGLHFCLLFGFPTETKEDRSQNITFFETMSKYLKRMPFFVTFNIFNLNYGTDVYKNPRNYNVAEIRYDDSDFNMMNIPYSSNNGNDVANSEYTREIDSLAADLTNIFVPSQVNQLLWFVMGDSPWELLYKEHYANIRKNPFQEGGGFVEKVFVKLYLNLEKNPTALKCFNFFTNKTIASAKAQIYR